jgi:hypothetical protein
MKIRGGPQQQDADAGTSTGTGSESTTTAAAATVPNTTAGSKPVGNTKDDDPFDHLDPRYKVERKLGEEGSVTNSLAMLTAIPEVDLGMECVSNAHPFFLSFFLNNFFLMRIGMGSTRLRNIEETEKAKLSLSHGRPREPQRRKAPDEEAHLAATRCASLSIPFPC